MVLKGGEIMEPTTENAKMQFAYSDMPQRSPEWLELKRGKIGASSLWRWLSVSKAKTGAGKPLKGRLDYEKELMFERQFNTSFEVYVNSAMQEGIDYEDFARKQYEELTGHVCREAGCYYSAVFVASPDRFVFPAGSNITDVDNAIGLIEVKILKDNSFTEVVSKDPETTHPTPKLDENGEPVLDAKGKPVMVGTGVPEKHWKQIQGQLWASKLPWCDYVALNFNTKKVVIIRVLPDQEFHDYLELAVPEKLVTAEFDVSNVYDIVGDIPEGVELGAITDRSDSNISGGW
jgi:hypothetical protein